MVVGVGGWGVDQCVQSVFGGALSASVRLRGGKSVEPKDDHYEKRKTGTNRDEGDQRLFSPSACSVGGGDGHGRKR